MAYFDYTWTSNCFGKEKYVKKMKNSSKIEKFVKNRKILQKSKIPKKIEKLLKNPQKAKDSSQIEKLVENNLPKIDHVICYCHGHF